MRNCSSARQCSTLPEDSAPKEQALVFDLHSKRITRGSRRNTAPSAGPLDRECHRARKRRGGRDQGSRTFCKKIGLRSVNISSWPNGTGWYAPGDENFFAAMVDQELVVAPHTNFGASGPKASDADFHQVKALDRKRGGACCFCHLSVDVLHFRQSPKSVVYIGESYASWNTL